MIDAMTYFDWLQVKKPGQYLSPELNTVCKDDFEVSAVLVYPDLYEVGLPNIGLQILYYLGNSIDFAFVDRAYAPDLDLAEKMKKKGSVLKSRVKKIPVRDFDVIGFTLQTEMTYTTLLYVLELSGLSLRSEERAEPFPLVIAGGPGAYNPLPLSPFIDVFIVGDGEGPFVQMLEVVREAKQKSSLKKKDLLKIIDEKVEGSFVPSFYRFIEDDAGNFLGFEKKDGNLKKVRVKRSFLFDSNLALLEKQLVPTVSVAHERAQIEISRGCRGGCRFCQAGFIYRPVREAEPEAVVSTAKKLLLNTGFEELGFVSLSTSDYTALEEVLDGLHDFCLSRNISISLPSLRMDSFSVELAGKVSATRKATLTFAPEAGTERLRRVINKNLKETDVEKALKAAFESGFQKIKLYFMIGLPTEEKEDLEGIAETVLKAKRLAKVHLPKTLKGKLRLHVSVSTFVPKPHTPFQWERQIPPEEAERRAEFIRKALKGSGAKISFHDHRKAYVEGFLARGGLSALVSLERAYRSGAVFETWEDRFNYELWKVYLAAIERVAAGFEPEALLPWEVIDSCINKDFLISERKKAYSERSTQKCHAGCKRCGVCGIQPLRLAKNG